MPRLPSRKTVLSLAFAALIAACALCASARWFWLGEIACHFRPYLALAVLLAAGGALAARRWRLLLALAALALWCGAPTLALYLPREEPALRGAPLRLVSSNVLWGSAAGPRLLEWIDAEPPDLLFLCGLDSARREQVVGLSSRGFAHQLIWPSPSEWTSSTWGRALVSRRPLLRAQVRWPGPILDAWIEHEGRELRVLGAHPVRPGRADMTAMRDEVLRELARLAAEQAEVVLLGDLNITEATPRYGELLERGALGDTRAGFGRLGSWSVAVPRLHWQLPWLRMPLDHVWIGGALAATQRALGPDIGSDHLPIAAVIGWR